MVFLMVFNQNETFLLQITIFRKWMNNRLFISYLNTPPTVSINTENNLSSILSRNSALKCLSVFETLDKWWPMYHVRLEWLLCCSMKRLILICRIKKKLQLLFSRNTIETNELLVFIDKLKVALNSNSTEAELKTIYGKKNNLCQPKSYVPFYFMDFLRTIFHFFAAEV